MIIDHPMFLAKQQKLFLKKLILPHMQKLQRDLYDRKNKCLIFCLPNIIISKLPHTKNIFINQHKIKACKF